MEENASDSPKAGIKVPVKRPCKLLNIKPVQIICVYSLKFNYTINY